MNFEKFSFSSAKKLKGYSDMKIENNAYGDHLSNTQQEKKQAVYRNLELVEKSRILGYVIDDILKYYKPYRRILSRIKN
jgi:hypothetical protein